MSPSTRPSYQIVRCLNSENRAQIPCARSSFGLTEPRVFAFAFVFGNCVGISVLGVNLKLSIRSIHRCDVEVDEHF